MLWKALSATLAVAVTVIIYYAIEPAANQLDTYIVLVSPFGSLSMNGVSVAKFASNTYNLFGVGIVLTLMALVLYIFAAAHADESDSGEII